MKPLLCSAIFLFMISCINNNQHSTQTEEYATVEPNGGIEAPTKNYVVANIVDSIITANPDYLDNDIKRNRVATEIQNTVINVISNNHEVLTEIPLTYEMMMPRGNDYIIKFELNNIGNNTRISNKYNIYFNVFTIMNADEAADLVDNQKYYLTFSSIRNVNHNLTLPSGRTFYDNPNVYKSSLGDEISVSLGGFLLSGVNFTKQ